MKALGDANDMPMISSYTIKSLFLKKRMIRYNQSPGLFLIWVSALDY